MALSLTPALPQHFFHHNTRSAHRAPAAGRRRGLNRAGRQRLAHSLHALVAFVTLFTMLFPLGSLVPTAAAAAPQARAHRSTPANVTVPAAGAGLAALSSQLLPTWLAGEAATTAPALDTALLPAWLDTARANAAAPALDTALLPAWLNTAPEKTPALATDLLPSWLGAASSNAAPALDTTLLPAWIPAGTTAAPVPAPAVGAGLLPNWFAPAGAPAAAAEAPALLGPGACPADPADLEVSLTLPAYTVSRGTNPGDVYTVTVTNSGAVSVPEVSLLINPNVGFYYLGSSATATSSLSGTQAYVDSGTGLPDANAVITLTGNSQATSLEPGETLTFTFRLATDANATSGQRLDVNVRSGDAPTVICRSTGENIPTARGNLTIQKSPVAQSAQFGDVVTWTVTLRNTGLGNVYSAVFTDTPGLGLANVQVTPTPAPISLTVNGSQVYTVTATIASCTQLTNDARASWSIGNADGTGTGVQPVSANTDILFTLADPDIAIEIGSLPTVSYCGPLSATVPVTVTNNGGTGRFLRLNVALGGVNLASLSPDWVLVGSTLIYQGGTPTGTILSGQVLTFNVQATTAGPVCSTQNLSIQLTPIVQDACLVLQTQAPAATASTPAATAAPTLNLTKDGPIVLVAGRSYSYTLTVSGQNRQSLTSSIVVTDLLPATIVVLGVTPSTGSVVTNTSQVIWTVPVTGAPGAYNETLIIDFQVPQVSACGAGTLVTNQAVAAATVCPQCAALAASAESTSFVQDMFDEGNNDFQYSGPSLEMCAAAPQPVTATLTFRNGVTWTNSIYTDTLGLGEFAQALHVVPGSVQVLLDGQDRTSDVSISLGAPLEINLSGLGTFSATAALTITYAITAGVGSINDDGATQNFFNFALFEEGGGTGSCTGGAVAFFGANVTLRRANLGVGVTPGTLQSCRENTVVLTVSGATSETLSSSLVVTFTADPSDVFTPTAPVLGGALAGQPVVVTKTGNLVTFTFPITLDLNGDGTIAFPLYRPCGVEGPLSAGVVYADQCLITRHSGGSGAATTQGSGVSLFTTPDSYTVVDLKALWRFYVSSVGEISAENVIITNTLPVGHSFYTYTASSGNAPLTGISYQTGLNGNGQVVVTLTIASLPVGGRIRFDMESRIDTACNLPATIDIALFQNCGAVNGTCGNRQTGLVTLLPSPTSLLSSNGQTANLPLCETGDVFLQIKNTSAQSLESGFTIRDIITNATFITGSASVTVTNEAGQIITGTTSGLPLANIPFAPAVTTAGSQQVLSWTLSAFISGTAGYDVLAIRQASDLIDIHFQVRTGCTGVAVDVQSAGNALDVCQRPLSYTEEAKTLLTDAPELALVKTACNATTDDCTNPANFAAEINAGAGETVVWKLNVANTGGQRVLNLFVTDTLPSNYTVTETLPAATSIIGSDITWHLTGTAVIVPGGSLDFLITGTVQAVACMPTATNTALAYFACGDGDQCLAGAVAGSAAMHNVPDITVQVVDTEVNQCGGGPLQIDVNNAGAYANNVVISYTLPANLRYAGLLTTTPTPAFSPTIGASGTLTWLLTTLTETATIRFAVVNPTGTCPTPPLTATATADGYYDDSCAIVYDDIDADDGTITFTRPDITGSLTGGALQLPITRVVAAGQVVTWNVAVRNAGTGAAENLLITETLGVGYTLVAAGVSTGTLGGAGATPVVAGQVITWLVPTLDVGGRFTATVTGTVVANPTNLHAAIDASSECDNGGCFQAVMRLDKSATTLAALVKTVSTSTIPIGLPFTYTITGTLFGNYTVTNTVLTDTLPTIDGQQAFSVTAVSVASSNGNPWQPGPLGGPVLTFTTPTGAVTGPETFTFTVEGVITDSLFADNGDVFTNPIRLDYNDDGFHYSFPRVSPPVTVIEPFLAISKTVTPSSGVQAGDRVTYTLSVSHAPSTTADAFDLVITDTLPAGLVLVPETVEIIPTPASLISDSRHLTATYDLLAIGGSVVISYSATADNSIRPASVLRNHAIVRWTSTADDPVGEERTGAGPNPDDHFAGTEAPFVTELVNLLKTVERPTYTIGEGITYTIRAALPLGTIPNTVVSDTLPAGLIFISGTASASGPGFGGSAAPAVLGSNNGSAPTTLVWNFGEIVNPITNPESLVISFTAAVANVAANQQGLTLTNVVTTTWYNNDDTTQTITGSVPVGLLEPTLIITKSVTPVSTRAGDTVQFDIWVYHAATSTVPAYNVQVTDTVPAGLTYLFNSWDQASGPAGSLDDGNAPTLTGFWASIPVTVTAANPIRLRFQVQAPLTIALGSLLTNTVADTWHSLPTNPYTQTRDGSGGVNDYRGQASAAVGVSEVGLTKTAPLTITAGTTITYVLGAHNYGPFTATGALVTDTMPFQVSTLTAAFSVPGGSSGACTITPNVTGDQVVCALGSLAPNVTALITITAQVPADVPEAADLTNAAVLTVTSPDGLTTNNSATTDTEVLTRADVGVTKTGPLTATAGQTVTYTVRVTNTGPSVARTVDVKDLLPTGMTYVGGSSSQGLCVSGICQFGDLGVNGTVTMVITASVGASAGGLVTNTAQVFSSTPDPVSANNTATAPTTIAASTRLAIEKTDLTDPVNAGSTYLYEIVLTNTGPSDAFNVVITDRLPSQVTFEGATPTCSQAGGVVTCTVGTLPAGDKINFLINTLVAADVVSGTQGTNTVGVTTTTPVAAGSVLTDSELTTYRQVAGNPTDLVLTKGVSPNSVTAGSGLITYTLRVTNTGPAAATAVQVVDAFPREFEFISADSTVGVCNSGTTCDLGALAVGQSVAITLVVAVPSDVSAGVYTNTATVSGAGPETTTANNTDSRPVTVVEQAELQIRKAAFPSPATPGEALYYTILVTNTGPSDADNVTVADVLPAGFNLSLVTSSQGGCAALPCNLGTLPAGGYASVTLAGTVAANATSVLTNVASVASTTPGTGAAFTVTTPLANMADVAVVKSATPTALAGGTVAYTVTVYNLGPSDATGVLLTDTLPAGVTLVSASLGCAPSGGQVLCAVGALTVGAQAVYTIAVTVNNNVEPGTSLENSAVVGSQTPDSNPSNNAANADTSIVGQADLALDKTGPASAVAGEVVTYTIVVTNLGPSTAQAVDVKDSLPAGLSLLNATIARTGSGPAACGGTVCQAGDLAVGERVTVTVTALVGTDVPDGALLTNSGTVFSGTSDPTPGNDTASVTTAISASADVSVAKVDLADPVGPTEGLLYQIVVANAGPSDAQNVVITDTLDANTTFVNASPGCVFGGGAVVCTVGTLPAGSSTSYLIAVTVGDVPSGTVLNNTVVAATTTTDPNPGNNTDTEPTTVQPPVGPTADLGITKTGTAAAVAGQNVTYTLVVTNAGPQTATNVRVLELIPAGTTVVSLTADNPASADEDCSLGGACYLGSLAPGQLATITVVLHVDASFTGALLTNTASVSADQADPNPGNNLASAPTTITTATDLVLDKVDLADPVNAGELLLYQLGVTNNGPSDALNVLITDTLPAGVTFMGASPLCAESAGVVTCALGTLAAGASASVLIQVRPNADLADGTVLTNNAVTGSDTPETNLSNNTDAVTTTVQQPEGGPVDLSIGKTGAPDPVIAGQTLTYTLVVTNGGPATAQDVIVVDALPAGVTFAAATSSQGTCNSGVTCLLGTLAPNATATITVVVTVNSGTTGVLLNLTQVTAANPETNLANNQASAVTVVDTLTDLVLTKTGPVTATPGAGLSYQIVVTNAGPSDAVAVVVSDTLPAALTSATAASSQGPCTVVAGLLTCNVGPLAAGHTATIVVNASVLAAASGTLTNTATVTSSTPETNTGNNSSTVVTTLAGQADLAITKTAAPDPVIAGELLTYTLTVVNNGPTAANAVTVTDQLPAGVTFVTATPGFSGPNPLVWNLGPLGVGATQTVTITVRVNSGTASGAVLANSASVASDLPDPAPNNNTAGATTHVQTAADLALDKTAQPDTVLAGELVTYTLVVTNLGPSTASGVQVLDALPAEVTLLSATTTRGVCGSGLCVLGSVPAGTVVTITLVTRAQTGLPLGTTFTNTALVFSPTPDPNPDNNQDDAPVTIATSADLAVDKRHSGSATAGQSFTYKVVVTNTGPSAAVNVIVTDTLPTGLTYSSATAACALQSSGPEVVACALGSLAAGASTSFEVTVLVDASLTGTVTNTVVVASDTPDGNPANNTDLDPTAIATLADVNITKTATPEPVTAGETVTYTLTVHNAGPSQAAAVVVTDTLPVNVTHVSDDAGCSVLGQQVVCALGALDPGQTVEIQIVVQVAAGTAPGTTLNNQAVVRSTTPDPNLGNNTAAALTTVVALADVVVDKSGPAGALVAGQTVTYTVVVSNAGPSTAADVDLKDFLPAGVTLLNAQTHTGAPCLGSLCQLGPLTPGAAVTITLTGTVDSDVPAGTVLTNTATAFTDTPDSNPANNTDTHANPVDTLARLELEKRDLNDPVAPESQLFYWVVVTNTGPSDALNVVITDTLPAEVSFMGSTGNCVALGLSELRCTVGTLPAGSTQSFFISVLVNATVVSGTVLVNDVSAGSSTPLDPTSVLTDSEPTLVQQFFGPPADLALAKAVTPTTVTAGELITWTLVVTNYGPATAQDVEVTDALPAGLTLVSAVSSQGTCDGAVTCLLGVMAYNVGQPSTATITLTARVNSGVPAGTVLTNTAYVQSAMVDPNQTNNTAQAVADVITAADLAIDKSDAPDPVNAGERLIYTLVITNLGPSDAVAVVVTDTLPAAVTFVSGDGCTDLGGGVIACALGNLAAGATATVNIVVDVAEDAPALLDNQAVVGSATPDPVPGNNTDTEPTTVLRSADLAVVKDVVTDTVRAGETLTYNLTIINYGPSAAEGVVVTDTLPPQVSFDSADPAQAGGPNPLLWNVGDLAVGASRSFTVVVTVLSNTLNAQLITNWAAVGATTPDPQPANNTDDAQAQVFGLADVAVQKFAPPSPVIAGEQVVYTISVTNLGPSVAEQVDLKDVLPAGLSLGTLTTSQGACVGALCQLGSLPVSSTAVITAVLNVDADVLSGTVLCNTAVDFAATPDPNSANNSSEACVTVAALVDVSLTKTLNGTAVPGGDPFLYTLVVTNHGPSDAQDVVVSDTLPAELSFVSAVPPQTGGPNPLTWNLGTLAAGAEQELSVWVRAQSWVTQTFTNTAVVTTTSPDTDPSNNSDDAPTGVSPLADLALVKTTDSPVAIPGNRIVYTLTVYNLGPSDAQDVVVTDTLPAEVSFVSASPTQDGGPNSLLWNLGLVPVGETRVITLAVDVLAGVEQSFRNNAVVSGSTPDPDPSNNADDVTHSPVPLVDLVLEKAIDHNPLEPDDEFYYTLVVRNDGPSVATEVRVSDLLPAEAIFVSATPAPNPGSGPLTWELGNLAPGDRVTLTINARLQPWATESFTNTAVVTSTAAETNPDNNTDDAPANMGVPTAPVSPLYFAAQADGRQVTLRWAYASEAATSGYRVLRAPANDLGQAVEVCLTAALGAATNYNCLDNVPQDGTWWYWLVRLEAGGHGSPGTPVAVTVSSAAPYRLWLPLIGKEGQE